MCFYKLGFVLYSAISKTIIIVFDIAMYKIPVVQFTRNVCKHKSKFRRRSYENDADYQIIIKDHKN